VGGRSVAQHTSLKWAGISDDLDALPTLRRHSRVAAIDALVQFESLDYFRMR
jgi:hypothetical protein